MELTKLQIKNATYYSFHGVDTAEKKLGGKFQVDLDIYYDAERAVANDDVGEAVNYNEILFTVTDIISNENYNLIESLANEILVSIIEKFITISSATIRIRKLNVPVNQYIDYIEVEKSLDRSDATI